MTAPHVYRKPDDLPSIIPVFPLDGALVLPRAPLPLNIFEPRYLNMVDDALSGARLIGMVQTRAGEGRSGPALAHVGCVGRLTSYTETPDGRYLITLSGVCRYRVLSEEAAPTPYRQARVDYAPYAHDLEPPGRTDLPAMDPLMEVLRRYLDANGLKAEWAAIQTAPPETLINSLAMICPFEPAEKQALLEARTLADRRDALVTLMRMSAAASPDGSDTSVQ